MEEMASRIHNLEKALAQATGTPDAPESHSGDVETTSAGLPAQERSPSYPHDLNGTPREGVLVQKGSSSHYFNDILLGRALAEVSHGNLSLTPSVGH